MNALLNLAVKLSGLGWVWKKIDGSKTRIGAAGLMLGGAGIALGGLAGLIAQAIACGDAACAINIAKDISNNPSAALVLQGFLTFKAGLLGIGLGHKFEKAKK